MLHLIKTKTTDTVLGKPQDWNDAVQGKCLGLPVTIEYYASGDCGVVSYWKPTFKQRLQFLFGGVIRLIVISSVPTQPPVNIDVVKVP